MVDSSEEANDIDRRTALAKLSTIGISAVAGCSSNESRESETPQNTEPDTTESTEASTSSRDESPDDQNDLMDVSEDRLMWGQYRTDARNSGIVDGTVGQELVNNWSKEIDLTYFFGVSNTDALFVATERDEDNSFRHLSALDNSTGEIRWEKQGDIKFSGLIASAASLYVFIEKDDSVHGITSLDSRNGQEQWTVEYENEVFGTVCLSSDKLVVPFENSTGMFGKEDGSRQTADFGGLGRYSVANNNIYRSDSNGIRAYSIESQQKIWSNTELYSAYLDGRSFEGAPVVIGDSIYRVITDEGGNEAQPTGYVVSIDAETGERNWEWKLEVDVPGNDNWTPRPYPPLAADSERLYLSTLYGHIVAVNQADGSMAWVSEQAGPAQVRPVVGIGDLLFVFSSEFEPESSLSFYLYGKQGGDRVGELTTESNVLHSVIPSGENIAFVRGDGIESYTW